MIKKRIWFNNWFNTAYHIINLIKRNDEMEFKVFGTNRNPNSAMLRACDHYEVEEKIPEEEYTDFCLDFCKKHMIDVFIPHSNISSISHDAEKFEEIGVKLLICCDFKNLDLLSDKAKFYDFLENTVIDSNSANKYEKVFNVPKYYIVNNANDFRIAYDNLIKNGNAACFKPVRSEGGAGFRIIDEAAGSLESLFYFSGSRITFDDAYKRLSQKECFSDLMVMEYLSGYEYSIDCLALNGRLISAVPRKKLDGRVRLLEESEELTKLASSLTRIFNLSYAYNIQVRYDGNIPKLLEINPRMSGGVWISCLSGINFPFLALKLLLDGDSKLFVPDPKFNLLVSQIENEILL
ncbi:MAG: ATP-grasp domain-containing protein [Bacillota bacterium]|nr:ATP-grasp domain-containing protein [Bacillota bacterium]